MQHFHAILNPIGHSGDKNFKSSGNPIAHSKGQKKNQSHNTEKNRHSPDRMGHPLIDLFCPCLFLSLIHQNLINNFFNKIVFLIDDLMLIVFIDYVIRTDRIIFHDFWVFFKHFNSVPSRIDNIREIGQQTLFQVIDLIFNVVRINHGKFFVMIMTVNTLTY